MEYCPSLLVGAPASHFAQLDTVKTKASRSLESLVMKLIMPGVGLMVQVVCLGSKDPELKSHLAVKLIPGGVDSAYHPSEVGKMSASLQVSCVGVVTRPGLCTIANETA